MGIRDKSHLCCGPGTLVLVSAGNLQISMVGRHEGGQPGDVLPEHLVPRAVRLLVRVQRRHVQLRAPDHSFHGFPVTKKYFFACQKYLSTRDRPGLSSLLLVGGGEHGLLLERGPGAGEEGDHQLRLLVHHVGGQELPEVLLQFLLPPVQKQSDTIILLEMLHNF